MKFWLMLVGRIVFGIGCESMYVGQSAIISEWFINYEMPLAMAMCSCIPLCGSFIGGSVIPKVYGLDQGEDEDVGKRFGHSFGVGFLVCIFSFVVVIFIFILDRKMEIHDTKLLNDFKGVRPTLASKMKNSNVVDT